jgi:hypothetical protein
MISLPSASHWPTTMESCSGGHSLASWVDPTISASSSQQGVVLIS